MADWLRRLLRVEYVGTVTARTQITKDGVEIPGGVCVGRWILLTSVFGRHAKLSGYPGASEFAQDVEARVAAWKAGGPLPHLDQDTAGSRRKAAPVLKLHEGGKE